MQFPKLHVVSPMRASVKALLLPMLPDVTPRGGDSPLLKLTLPIMGTITEAPLGNRYATSPTHRLLSPFELPLTSGKSEICVLFMNGRWLLRCS